MTEKPFRIMIVDDHPIFCLGMTELINKEPDLLVTAGGEPARLEQDPDQLPLHVVHGQRHLAPRPYLARTRYTRGPSPRRSHV